MNVQAFKISGHIFDIQHFCLDDGPGIRTTVFLKGCPLRCIWCHNPESYEMGATISFQASKCVLCGACEAICPVRAHKIQKGMHILDRASCIRCGRCVEVCCYSALKQIGRTVTVDEVMEEVRKDVSYYGHKKEGKGGLTVSGGEPFAQPEFLLELLKQAKAEGITTCIETSGYTSAEWMERTFPYTDLYLFDIKGAARDYKTFTGVGTEQIFTNLKCIVENEKRIVARIPMIPGINDTEEFFEELERLYEAYPGIEMFEIMPYHGMGSQKAAWAGIRQGLDKLPDADEVQKENWLASLRKKGIPCCIEYFK